MPHRLSRKNKYLIVALVALALRLPGLWWGLPGPTHLFSYHPDEFHSLRGVLSLSRGDPNPHFFNYGCFYLYAVSVAAEVASPRLFARVSRAWEAPDANRLIGVLPQALRFWTLLARCVSLCASVGTVVAVAATAEALGFSGLWAGLALAVMPFHALTARYGTVDPTLTFWVALAVLLSAKAQGRQSGKWLAAAGVAAGLAASTKYTGWMVVIVPLTVAVARREHWRAKLAAAGMVVACCAAAFAATSPYVFVAWSEASRDIAFEMRHMRVGEYPAVAAEPSGLLFHAKWLLLGSAGLALVGAAGLISWCFGRQRNAAAVAVVILATAWLAVISAARVRYARYELPLLPLLALGCAYAARWGRWRPAIVALAVAGLAECGLICVATCRPDARDMALGYILQHSAPEEAVGMIWEPWFQSPPIDYCNGGAVLRHHPLWRIFSRELRPLCVLDREPGRLSGKDRPPWVVISDVELRDYLRAGDRKAREMVAELRKSYAAAAEWNTVFGSALMPSCLSPPHDWLYPAMPLRLYRLRGNKAR